MKQVFLALFTTLLFLSNISCQKEKAVKGPDEQLLETARQFFDAQVKTTSGASTTTPLQTLTKAADWEKAHIQNLAMGKVVTIPLDFKEQMIGMASSGGHARSYVDKLSKLMIYTDAKGKMQADVVMSIPDSVYRKNQSGPFSGIVIVNDWNMQTKRAYHYEGGLARPIRLDKKPGIISTDPTARVAPSSVATMASYTINCSYIEWNIYVGGEYSYTYTQSLGCTISGDGGTGGGGGGGGVDPNDNPAPPGEGGGGGSDAPAIPFFGIQSIINQFINPCIVAAKEKLPNFNLNIFANSLLIFHNNQTVNWNIKFQENRNLPADQPGDSHPDGNTWVIELNPGFWEQATQPDATQEIAGITILHEIVHGYLYVWQDAFAVGPLTNFSTHEDMFKNMIISMRDVMMNSFGLNYTDATALALMGLDDVLQQKYSESGNLTGYNQAYSDFALQNYQISIPQADAIQSQYISGQKGTKCF
ncbi:hypothetical protein [Chitinophaga sp. SYP-B3965]|uniref:hypothetical protein n=1 Tax=Chitinophaga sp. SYP-B3965 TaxID=2663120 RepID=UPI001C12A2B5|nr:hypothetical protein [Chitinophaga sp. SYP-B3965]